MTGKAEPLDYDNETLQTTIYSTRRKLIRARWTRILISKDYTLLMPMKGKAQPMGLGYCGTIDYPLLFKMI